MKLVENLYLSEMTKSTAAIRHGIDNTPNEAQIENMILWAENIFTPIRQEAGEPIFISSGFRAPRLNVLIGGSPSSDHCWGFAGDIDQDNRGAKYKNIDVFEFAKSELDFDQLIWEFGEDAPAWVHASYRSKKRNRNQILRAYKVYNKRSKRFETRYKEL